MCDRISSNSESPCVCGLLRVGRGKAVNSCFLVILCGLCCVYDMGVLGAGEGVGTEEGFSV